VQNAFQSSCKWYGVTVAIALVNLLQSIESAGVCASIVQIAHIYIIRCRTIVYIYICIYIYMYIYIYNDCYLAPVTDKRVRQTPGLASATPVTNVDFWYWSS
jgi:hypothetical protein